jgi:ABC-2 type transport system permease protein
VLQGVIVLLLSMLVGFKFSNWASFPLALLFMSLIAIVFTAFGTAIASIMDDMHGFQMIMNFVIMPVFFLSGALFPLDGLPPTMATVVRLNPMTYGVDGLRLVLTGASQIHVLADFGVLAVISVLFSVIGAYLFSKIQI